MKILLVEDEPNIGELIKESLGKSKINVDIAITGEEALKRIWDFEYDLLIIDLGLPGIDGFEVIRQIREEEYMAPILILTARDTLDDKVVGLNQGADDYMVKPFEAEELLARIRAIVRRNDGRKSSTIRIKELEIDPVANVVTRAGKEIRLTAREYALLEYLARNKNRIISKSAIIDNVWDSAIDPFSNVVDVYIGYLRNKVDKEFGEYEPLVETVKGMGYRIRDK